MRNWIDITDYQLSSKLPDTFLMNSGKRVASMEDWQIRRAELYETAVELQYGTMPPAPEFLEVVPMCLGAPGRPSTYGIRTGTREHPVTLNMTVFKAAASKCPAVISGDLCFPYPFDQEYIRQFTDNGIHFVLFNRTELAPDIAAYNLRQLDQDSNEPAICAPVYETIATGCCGGQLKRAYPDKTFGAIGAWAWGYSRCVDALELLGIADLYAFTGHSRGGKTALLAGVLDQRAAIVNPNGSGTGGAGCYRVRMKAIHEDGEEKAQEPLDNIVRTFPAWMGPAMKDYVGREAELPFDSHDLKALVAPRVLLDTEAASDIWANPVGTWQTNLAAREVYRFHGCPENLLWHYRSGYHCHQPEDVALLVNVMRHIHYGEPLQKGYNNLVFAAQPPAFDWKTPK